MAITNLTELVQSLSNDPTLATVPVTTDGTSVSQLRLNPISSGIAQKATTETVTVTAPLIEDTTTISLESPTAVDNDQGTTNELLITDLDGRLTDVDSRLTVVEGVVVSVEESILNDSVLTGIPTAPTAPSATNTTQIATTAFVTSSINILVSDADSNIGSITSSLALKAPLASPSFTGTASFAGATTFSSSVTIDTPLAVASGGTGGSSTSVALNNLLPSGETAGYVLKTNGPGSYFWDAETGAGLIVGTRINTSRTFFNATEGQTLFEGIGEYTPGAGQLRVYLDGVRQFDSEYTETSSTSFTLDVGVPSGTIVLAEVDGFVSYPVTANAVSVTPTGGISATDAQNALAGLDARAFVAGMIIMWSGAIAGVPAGWALCDGTNSTPDLRDRMVIGASADDAGVAKTNVTGSPTLSGGSKDAINVSHTHTITDAGHNHFIANTNNTAFNANPTLSASTYMARANAGGTGVGNSETYSLQGTATTPTVGLTSTKTTGITIDSEGSSGTDANLPPYYALAFIMKL